MNAIESSSPPSKRIKIDPCTASVSLEPIHPKKLNYNDRNWHVCQDGKILYRHPGCFKEVVKSKIMKVAGFNLRGALLASQKQYPHTLEDYELWNQNVIGKLRSASDDGYHLIIFANQGGIRSAVNGKTASKIKHLIEWLSSSSVIDRPIAAFISTMKKSGFHKPSSDMWNTAEKILGYSFDKVSSFFVGGSIDYEQDGNLISGDDESFARNIGLVSFITTTTYFGSSDLDSRREKQAASQQLIAYKKPPTSALETRVALQSGNLQTGILLLLSGPQGCGKSFFCHELVSGDAHNFWIHLSQDTIRNGKPGSREAVEQSAKKALAEKKNVVIDRMHLDPDQRSHFVQLAKNANIPVHIVAFTTPKAIVTERVLKRQNHVAKVEGQSGAKMASASWLNFVMPKYDEGFNLITATGTPEGVQSIVHLYRRVGAKLSDTDYKSSILESYPIPGNMSIPSISLGTYKLGKRNVTQIVSLASKLGIDAVDTAPTYNNEEEVGIGTRTDTFLIAKIPKRATTANQVRQELELTLNKLNRKNVNLLLLHWPSDVITSDTLKEVWLAMEKCVQDGLAKSLGVCNFNISALRLLLTHCSTARPIVNQVERHVLLPQWELVDFCAQQDILIQAHSPLGQGKLLDHDTVQEVAACSGLTPAQVLLQWNLCQQIPIVTKCSSREHLLDVIGTKSKVLSAENMLALNGISDTKRFVSPPFMFGNEAFCWDQ